jgi:hypothetical protein
LPYNYPKIVLDCSKKKNKIHIQPKIINIKTKTGLELDRINIYNIEGRLVYYQDANLNNVNLQNISSGTYFIQAFSGDKIVTKKIIKN